MKPKWLINAHHFHAIFVCLLLLTGLCLYIQPLRTTFNEWKIPLVAIHIWIAIFYILVVLFSLRGAWNYIYKRAFLKKFNVTFIILLCVAWFVSGLVMYFHISFPATARNLAVTVHDVSTWISLPWIVVHSIGHSLRREVPWPLWWKRNTKKPEWIEENRLERRDFVKSLLMITVMVFIGGWVKWLSPILNISSEANLRRGYFRIYNVTNDYPRYEPGEWNLTIDGLVDEPITLSLPQIRQIKWVSIIDDFHCVTGWSVKGVELKGVYIKDLFETFDISPKNQFVTAYSGDEMYFDTFKLSQLLEEAAMLVFELDGEPLKYSQGYPCRLYHPTMYGFKSVKWLNRLTIRNEREYGYWQQNGDYDLDGYL